MTPYGLVAVLGHVPDFTGNPVVDVIVTLVILAAGITAIGTIGKACKWLRDEVLRPARDFRDDWFGTLDRPGVPGRDGVMQRLSSIENHSGRVNIRLERIEAEVFPNNGKSLRDAVDRTEARVNSSGED